MVQLLTRYLKISFNVILFPVVFLTVIWMGRFWHCKKASFGGEGITSKRSELCVQFCGTHIYTYICIHTFIKTFSSQSVSTPRKRTGYLSLSPCTCEPGYYTPSWNLLEFLKNSACPVCFKGSSLKCFRVFTTC